MVNNKKLKDYFNLGMRKLKHRKGFGVHSPFAFSIITEMIEEKLPYYAYRTMQPIYNKQAPISFKVACLLLRIANRFRCRTFAEVSCNGGYSMLPILLTDRKNHISSLANQQAQKEVLNRLALFQISSSQYSFIDSLNKIDGQETFDMLVINDNPFVQNDPQKAAVQLVEWTMQHIHQDTIIFVSGIQPRQKLELYWDMLCDRDDISITMDLYNSGLAIIKPNFFKQHYIVAF